MMVPFLMKNTARHNSKNETWTGHSSYSAFMTSISTTKSGKTPGSVKMEEQIRMPLVI